MNVIIATVLAALSITTKQLDTINDDEPVVVSASYDFDTNIVKRIVNNETGGTNTLVHTDDISDMATKTWVEDKKYVTESVTNGVPATVSNVVTKTYVEGLGVEMGKIDAIYTNGVEVVLSNKIANLVIPQPPAVSYPVTDVKTNGVSVMDGTVAKLDGLATERWVDGQNYIKGSFYADELWLWYPGKRFNYNNRFYVGNVTMIPEYEFGIEFVEDSVGPKLSITDNKIRTFKWGQYGMFDMYEYGYPEKSGTLALEEFTVASEYGQPTTVSGILTKSKSDTMAEVTNQVNVGYLCTTNTAASLAENAKQNALYTIDNDQTIIRWNASGAAGQKLKHGDTAVTADDVGARHGNWMPTADEVGALSTEWAGDFNSEFRGTAFHSIHSVGAQYLSGSYQLRADENTHRWGTENIIEEGAIEPFAFTSELPTPTTPAFVAAFASKTATETAIANLSTTSATHTAQIDQWENYWRGDRVRLSVTNYYGNMSGELPRLRIEEFDHSTTTVVDNVQVISNFFHTVWDETDRQTNYMTKTDAKIVAVSNSVMESAWRQTNLQLANKAPRAWQSVTSAGEDAPPNMVWHTAPNTVFAGGTEYAHVAVGEGSICVLTDRGAPVYTDGAEGQFRFQDQTGENYFGFDVRSAYKIGCRTDGISVDPAQHIVSLTYDLTSATDPSILCSTNLVDWADAEVEWEQNPPAGTKVCYINVGNQPQGFYQAEIRYAGGSKFLTNMQADLMGGIAASNEVLGVTQSIYPTITATGVVWKVMQ